MNLKFYKKHQYSYNSILILLLVAIIAYWQVAFLNNGLKWDMLDVVFPYRFYVGECLQNGYLPLWNPYQQLGYPIHADLQCPTWYPETLLIGFLFGYNIYTMHFLFVFYIFLAGFGMYRLIFYFTNDRNAALIIGIAYMLSGFFVAHAQALFAIIGAVWIPFVLLYYLRLSKKFKYLDALKASVFMFLMISGGYQAFTIMLGYFLLIILVYFIITFIKEKNYSKILKLLKLNLIFLVITLLLSTVIIITTYQVSPFADRMNGLPLSSVMICPLSPQSLISLLIPFAVVKEIEFFNTDISMNNIYMGVIILIFFIYSLFRKKKSFEKLLLYYGLFMLLVSFGHYLPLRKLLYDYVPLMDMFRFPSYFSLFAIICFQILAGVYLSKFFQQLVEAKRQIIRVIVVVFVSIVILLVYSAYNIYFGKFTFLQPHDNLLELLNKSTIFEHIFIHCLIQLGILSIFLFFLMKREALIIKAIKILVIVEMIVAVQLNINYTAVSEARPQQMKKDLANMPGGFPKPGNENIINRPDGEGFWPFWRNTAIFRKTPAFTGFSSFWLKNHMILIDSFPQLHKATLSNPIVFFSDKLFPWSSIPDSLDPEYDNKNIYVNDDILNELSHSAIKSNKDDTVFITNFSPNEIVAEIQSKNSQVLTLLQNNYKGWRVYVDDREIEHFTSNLIFISLMAPAGKHIVRFKYQNPMVVIGFWISYISFVLLLIFIAYNYYRNRKNHFKEQIEKNNSP